MTNMSFTTSVEMGGVVLDDDTVATKWLWSESGYKLRMQNATAEVLL